MIFEPSTNVLFKPAASPEKTRSLERQLSGSLPRNFKPMSQPVRENTLSVITSSSRRKVRVITSS
jgi:hypothetical protein